MESYRRHTEGPQSLRDNAACVGLALSGPWGCRAGVGGTQHSGVGSEREMAESE